MKAISRKNTVIENVVPYKEALMSFKLGNVL